MVSEGPGYRIVLRDMDAEDIRQVKRIESAAYQDAWPSRIFESELENGFAHYRVAIEEPADGGTSGRIASLKRRVVGHHDHILGFMGVWYMLDQLHLVTIAVDPNHQGRGIGQRLLLDCFDLAKAADLNEIVLEVRVSNERARALYEHFGFRRAGTLRAYYQDNHEDAVVMLSGPLDSEAAQERLARIRANLRIRFGAAFEDVRG